MWSVNMKRTLLFLQAQSMIYYSLAEDVIINNSSTTVVNGNSSTAMPPVNNNSSITVVNGNSSTPETSISTNTSTTVVSGNISEPDPSISNNSSITVVNGNSSTPAAPSCYNSTTALGLAVREKNPFVMETYTICPNTFLEIGYPDGEAVCCIGGEFAILPRSNSLIQCGEDGDPKNNCTLNGGQYQLFAVEPTYDEFIENFKIKGVTFQNGANSGVLLVQAGDMVFEDCIWKDHFNRGPIYLAYRRPSSGRRRMMQEVIEGLDFFERVGFLMKEYDEFLAGSKASIFYVDDEEERRLAEENNLRDNQRHLQAPTRQKVQFNGCDFFGNGQGAKSAVTQPGVLSAGSAFNDVFIERATFHNNVYTESPKGYAISIREGSTLELSDSCFVDNTLLGDGVVEVLGDVYYNAKNNAGGSNAAAADDLKCQFLAFTPQEDEEPICIDFDSTTCATGKVRIPSTITDVVDDSADDVTDNGGDSNDDVNSDGEDNTPNMSGAITFRRIVKVAVLWTSLSVAGLL